MYINTYIYICLGRHCLSNATCLTLIVFIIRTMSDNQTVIVTLSIINIIIIIIIIIISSSSSSNSSNKKGYSGGNSRARFGLHYLSYATCTLLMIKRSIL